MNEVIDPTDTDIEALASDIEKGLLVPVLGGDINLCGRPPQEDATPGTWEKLNYPPTNWELALYLLKEATKLPLLDDLQKLANVLTAQIGSPQDSMSPVGLANVCQYIQVTTEISHL